MFLPPPPGSSHPLSQKNRHGYAVQGPWSPLTTTVMCYHQAKPLLEDACSHLSPGRLAGASRGG